MGNAYATAVELDIVDLYDWGRTYSYSSGTWTPNNQNPYDSTSGSSMTAGTTGNSDGDEDSWGIAQVDQILAQPSSTILFDKDASGSSEITIFFWGFDDDSIAVPDTTFGNTTIGSVGGYAEIWMDTSPDFDASLGAAGRSDGGDPSHYDGVTDDGTLLLALSPVAQNAADHTLITSFNFGTLTGSGTMYLDVTGGAWASQFDTDGELFDSDVFFQFTSNANTGGEAVGDWTVRGDGRGEANIIPEPTTMLMFGVGMLGAGVVRRKRKVTC